MLAARSTGRLHVVVEASKSAVHRYAASGSTRPSGHVAGRTAPSADRYGSHAALGAKTDLSRAPSPSAHSSRVSAASVYSPVFTSVCARALACGVAYLREKWVSWVVSLVAGFIINLATRVVGSG